MLTLVAPQPESLWDESLPVEVRELPEDLAALDVLLSDPELLWPFVERWQREFRETGRLVLTEGRPTIAMETFVVVLKRRYRWGYRRWWHRCWTRTATKLIRRRVAAGLAPSHACRAAATGRAAAAAIRSARGSYGQGLWMVRAKLW